MSETGAILRRFDVGSKKPEMKKKAGEKTLYSVVKDIRGARFWGGAPSAFGDREGNRQPAVRANSLWNAYLMKPGWLVLMSDGQDGADLRP
ncbi:MAG: hypothetical protein AAF718_05520 [Pseudomonadota bacterium]